ETGGHSMIVAPDGEIVVDANHEPGVIRATIDPKRKFIKPRSHGQPDIEHGQLMSRHRRPDVYRMNLINAT
ncbi:MAG: nitrilase-related carbon-nitrogen hydrolase, partial [Candidatus Latescibacterota bacterium]|nr:nitrilase-related carbon-nitrogen hydrolase [Candidatus Latescibacterota bacterium]